MVLDISLLGRGNYGVGNNSNKIINRFPRHSGRLPVSGLPEIRDSVSTLLDPNNNIGINDLCKYLYQNYPDWYNEFRKKITLSTKEITFELENGEKINLKRSNYKRLKNTHNYVERSIFRDNSVTILSKDDWENLLKMMPNGNEFTVLKLLLKIGDDDEFWTSSLLYEQSTNHTYDRIWCISFKDNLFFITSKSNEKNRYSVRVKCNGECN